jgi:hypothetical protein
MAATLAGWPTPAETNADRGGMLERTQGERRNLQDFSLLAGWPTPRNEDSEQTGAHRGVPDTLNSASKLAGWPTCSSRDWKDTPGMAQEGMDKSGKYRNRIDQLPRTAMHLVPMAGWPTPSSLGSAGEISEDLERKGEKWVNKKTGRVLQTNLATDARGLIPSSSPAATASPAGFRLNPLFSLWLQGFPPAEWGSCGERAMQSCRRSPRRS